MRFIGIEINNPVVWQLASYPRARYALAGHVPGAANPLILTVLQISR